MKHTLFLALTLGYLSVSSRSFAQVTIAEFKASIAADTVTYTISGCGGSGKLELFHSMETSPEVGAQADQSRDVTWGDCSAGNQSVSLIWSGAPPGLHRSWVRLEGQLKGPLEVRLCADLKLASLQVESEGAAVTFKVRVCNEGELAAQKFRVGLWPNRDTAPSGTDMGQRFEPIKSLGAGECKDLDVYGGLQPNGDFKAWGAVDSGGFIDECREDNNTAGPVAYRLRNPDLVMDRFTARSSARNVQYEVRVCNKGAADVGLFFVDIFFDRPDRAPAPSEPGDRAKGVQGLGQQQCTTVRFEQEREPTQSLSSYATIDADDFIVEPNEGNNFSAPLRISALSGTASTEGECLDLDGDGAGVGAGCVGITDCDDLDATLSPSANEVCGDAIDQDCDLTPDDGCEGVRCVDGDGDSFGVGPDCVLPDPNDADPNVHPWSPPAGCVDQDRDGWGTGPACGGQPDCDDGDPLRHPGLRAEVCGNAIDDDCDYTVDDGCAGVDCVDGDGDGWGKGSDCVVSDPDDANPSIHPYAACADADGDGYGTGRDCLGVPDCDDRDETVHPGAKESCDDTIDNDCDLTVNDGCPGVNCVDRDGDSFGVGSDCVLVDCDDGDAKVFPLAAEVCGDNRDSNCNGIADDGCHGRGCADVDGDGFGVGRACPRAEDCDDSSIFIRPGAREICGDGVDQDCDGVADDGCDTVVDKDGDGSSVGAVVGAQPDCDDRDPDVRPGAEEVCGDGIDNDCTGTVDDGCPGVACQDTDGDGWGTGKDCQIADCADDDPDRHPWAAEVCGDGKDNDCDGTPDDGCTDVDCIDGDGDGWGRGTACKVADCDDSDGGTNPWAREICNDGKDNNCNGSIDEDCPLCEDHDGDGHGLGPKCGSWDCNDGDANTFPGAPEICDARDNNCDETVPSEELDCASDEDGQGCRCRVSAASGITSSLGSILLLVVVLIGRGRRRRALQRNEGQVLHIKSGTEVGNPCDSGT